MSGIWNAMALILGHHKIKKQFFFPNCDPSAEFWVPVTAVALYDGQHRILVDTGYQDTEWVDRHVTQARCEPGEELDNALRQGPGWRPEDVDLVINTHLHFDHCGNNHRFQNARFVVHRREWQAACAVPEEGQGMYLPSLYDESAVPADRWDIIDGDMSCLSGLDLIETPGHSAGHMSVLVKTEEGILCVAGDMCCTLENLRNGIVNQSVYSCEQAAQSYEKVKRAAEYILPGHDGCIQPFQSSGFPRI